MLGNEMFSKTFVNLIEYARKLDINRVQKKECSFLNKPKL